MRLVNHDMAGIFGALGIPYERRGPSLYISCPFRSSKCEELVCVHPLTGVWYCEGECRQGGIISDVFRALGRFDEIAIVAQFRTGEVDLVAPETDTGDGTLVFNERAPTPRPGPPTRISSAFRGLPSVGARDRNDAGEAAEQRDSGFGTGGKPSSSRIPNPELPDGLLIDFRSTRGSGRVAAWHEGTRAAGRVHDSRR